MNSLDVIFLVIIILFTIRGLFRGLITEFIVLTALIMGYFFAFSYLGSAIRILHKFFPLLSGAAAKVISFILIFLIVNIILRIAGKFLNKIVKYVFLQSVNRLAGGLFAFIKVTLIISLLLILIDFLPLAGSIRKFIGAPQSRLYLPVKHFAPQVYNVIMSVLPGSGGLQGKVMQTIQQADSTARRLVKPF